MVCVWVWLMIFNYWKAGRAQLAETVENGSCLSFFDHDIDIWVSCAEQRSSMYEMCKSEPWFAGYFPLIWENFLREKCQKCAYRGFMCSKAGKISAAIQYCGKKVESLSIAELFPYLYFSIFLAFFWMKSQPNLFSVVVNQWECSVHTH